MKKLFKFLGYIIAGIGVFVVGAVLYVNSALPDVPLQSNFQVSNDSAKIARGDYLVNNVTACFDCHAQNDNSKFASKPIAGTEGKGGNVYPEEAGFPGTYYAPNLTPYHLETWSDAEIYRALSSGVSKDGEPLFPLMPYHAYRYMSVDDAKAIIAYLRTLKPIENDVPRSEAAFPFSLILRTIPSAAEPMNITDKNNPKAWGEYLTHIAGCRDCHTPVENNQPIPGMDFSGGYEYPVPTGGIVRTANLTPDDETGIGVWGKEDFIDRFRYYQNNDSIFVKEGEFNSLMPWYAYSGMTDEDLGAIYDYLRSQKPIKTNFERFTPPAKQ